MGHDKLRKFAENETFRCLLQPDAKAIMFHGENGELLLKDHPIKGRWGEEMFGNGHPIIVPGGIVHLKTDSRFLHEYTMAVVYENSLHLLASTKDLYATAPEDIALETGSALEVHPSSALRDIEALYQVQTFYESMFLKMGIPITYMAFVIDHEGPYSYPEFDAAFWKAAEGPRRSFSHNPAKEK